MPIEFYISALYSWVRSDAFNEASYEASEQVLDVELDILDYEYAHGLVAPSDVSPDYVAPGKVLTEDELKARIILVLSNVGIKL